MNVLVLGGYGLIGLEIVKALLAAGHTVTGLARSAERGRALLPGATWIGDDLAELTEPGSWVPHLAGIEVVINAAGVLQASAGDRPGAVQRDAITALISASEGQGVERVIQISAVGAAAAATTDFLRTKGEADAALMASRLSWTIFRPGVVVGANAYGGTSLLRGLAAFPVAQPILMPEARMQTVALDDVVDAVVRALDGSHKGHVYDLVESESHRLTDVVAVFRAWLGFQPAQATIVMPRFIGRAVALAADGAGWLGWRSPLRSTALRVLEEGVIGDPGPWQDAIGRPLKSLPETLASLPSTVQERIYARVQLALPIALVMLSLFWIVSGLVGLWQLEAATKVLAGALPGGIAKVTVIAGSVADIAIGVALATRRLERLACVASILLAASYLFMGTVLTPHLWADPLGVFVKVFPAMVLALFVAAVVERR